MGPAQMAGHSSLWGDSLQVCSVIVWVIYTLLGRWANPKQSGILITTISSFFGVLFLIPFAAYEALAGGPTSISHAAWMAIAYLGLGPSALGFFLWNFSLSHLGAGQVATYIDLVPVVGIATAVLFMIEPILIGQLIGGMLGLVGVYLANR